MTKQDGHENEWKNDQTLTLGVHSPFMNIKITFCNIKNEFLLHGNLFI